MEQNRIRLAGDGDAQAVLDIYAPSILASATSFETAVPPVSEMERRIHEANERHVWLVFERDGVVLGYAYSSPHKARAAYRWSVEFSVYVSPAAHRRGIARALYASLEACVSTQGYVNACAAITQPNPSSVRLHEAFEFTPVGIYRHIGYKFGTWHDVALFERRLLDTEVPTAEPLRAAEVLGRDSIGSLLAEQARRVR